MTCSYATIEELVVHSIQQDYITAAEHQRLVHSLESANRNSLWSNLLGSFNRTRESRARQEEARSYVRPEIQPTA